jgi:GNAT superfamily N-acetyltransferase
MVSVADCQRVQTNWFRMRAEVLGGLVWADGPLTWIDGPDGLNLMFPETLAGGDLGRAVEHARQRGLPIVGAWLGLEVDPGPLAQVGFERGWSPWWMTADLSEVAGPPDARVLQTIDTEDDDVERFALTHQQPVRAWCACAYAEPSRQFAGRAWSFLDEDLAGIFDMDVWQPFRRRGLGTGLLRSVCASAQSAGARHAVLNATPEGKKLYDACGFTQIGEGSTWWLHLDN